MEYFEGLDFFGTLIFALIPILYKLSRLYCGDLSISSIRILF